MTRYFYDCEFLEDGKTIELISIGIVAEDGREYYAIPSNLPDQRIARHPWLMDNVVPSLPRIYGDAINRLDLKRNPLRIDWNHPDIKPYNQIAREVASFLRHTGNPELWAWYGAYDHVALAQLFGPMSEMPGGIPYWTNDIRQEAQRLGFTDSDLPEQPDGVHNALADARHNKIRYEWLKAHERQKPKGGLQIHMDNRPRDPEPPIIHVHPGPYPGMWHRS